MYQLGLLILFSFLFSGSIFLVLQAVSTQEIEASYSNQDFLDALLEDEVAKIQHYITFNGITTQQFYKIDQWIDRDVITSLFLYYKNRLVYSSDVSYQEKILDNGIKRKPLPWEKSYPIQFKDKELQLSLTVELKDHEYNRALLVNLLIVVILFISCVLFFVHRKICEISKLEQQIQMMQGGSLGMPIEVKGDDEIASLAESLEEMRYAFVQQMEYEKVQESTGKLFASSVSHDVRTPLAALIGYLDILVHNRTSDESKRKTYLIKSWEKAEQLKLLTDEMFDYYSVSKEGMKFTGTPMFIDNTMLENMIYDYGHFLELKGYEVTITMSENMNYRLHMNRKSIQRILDNMVSNIIKYAEKSQRISIAIGVKQSMLTIALLNGIKMDVDGVTSTKLGLNVCKQLLVECGGKFLVKNKMGYYQVIMEIPFD